MKKISLKEGRLTKERLLDELESLQQKRKRIATVNILSGENVRDFIDVTADVLTKQIDACIESIVATGDAVRRGEAGITGVPKDGNMAAFRERAALLLQEAELCKEMGGQTPKLRETEGAGANGVQLVSVATYDIKAYEVRAERLRSEADSLAMRMAQMELETMVEI